MIVCDVNAFRIDFISFLRIEIDLVRCSFMLDRAVESFVGVRELREEFRVLVDMV